MCVSWPVPDLSSHLTRFLTHGVGDLFGGALGSCQPGSPESVHWHLSYQESVQEARLTVTKLLPLSGLPALPVLTCSPSSCSLLSPLREALRAARHLACIFKNNFWVYSQLSISAASKKQAEIKTGTSLLPRRKFWSNLGPT